LTGRIYVVEKEALKDIANDRGSQLALNYLIKAESHRFIRINIMSA
jgi:hypothetical protein